VGFAGAPLRECLGDVQRLGSLRAGSQVIRAYWVWRVNDEARMSAHHLLAPPLLIRRIVVDFEAILSRKADSYP
jgi:hypothetical protein